MRELTAPDGKRRKVLDLLVYFQYPLPPACEPMLDDTVPLEAWKEVFIQASDRLFDATEGQLRFGTITFTDSSSLSAAADIRIGKGSAPAAAYSDGLGVPGLFIQLSQLHLCTGTDDEYCPLSGAEAEDARSTFGIVHELGHYLFDLEDEYLGCMRQAGSACPPRATSAGARYFCGGRVAGADNETSCVMDGGTESKGKNLRREMCITTKNTSSPFRHVPSADVSIAGSPSLYYANAQEARYARSCWDVMAFGSSVEALHLTLPNGDPKPQRLPPLEEGADRKQGREWLPTFRVVSAARGLGVVLAVDVSKSMNTPIESGGDLTRLDLAREGARNIVARVRPTDSVGMIAFGNAAATAVDLGEADAEHVQALRDRIAAISATDTGTALGDALVDAEQMLDTYRSSEIPAVEEGCDLEVDVLAGRIVILLSDGRSNRGARPSDLLELMKLRDRVVVYTIALGAEADASALKEIADATGGKDFSVLDPVDLPSTMAEVLDAARGETFLLDERSPPSHEQTETRTVDVPPGAGSVTFTLGYLPGSDFSVQVASPVSDGSRSILLDPDGVGRFEPARPEDGAVTGSNDPVLNPAQQFVRIVNPPSGEWTIVVSENVPSDTAPEDLSSWRLLASADAPALFFRAYTPVTRRVEYPAAIPIYATVGADGPLADVDVEATIVHPGGAVTEGFRLYDDGEVQHGDEKAGDGIYSNRFQQYLVADDGNGIADDGGNGTYVFRLRAVNTGQARVVVDGEENAGGRVARTIPPFSLTTQTTVSVSGIPEVLPAATAEVVGGGTLETLFLSVSELSNTPVIAFSVTAGREPLYLNRVLVTSFGSGIETDIDEVSLYRDGPGNQDTYNSFRALARATFDEDDGTAVLMNPAAESMALAIIPAGTSQGFILTLAAPRLAPGTGLLAVEKRGHGSWIPQIAGELWIVGLALWLLALSWVLRARSAARPLAQTAGLILLLILTGAVGCGGSGWIVDEFTTRQDPTGSFNLTLAPADLGLVSAIRGQPVTATGEGFTRPVVVDAVEGP